MPLSILRQLKLFISSLFLQASWSFSGMQTLGFVTTLLAGARDPRHRDALLKNQKELFNTQPYLASYIIGAVLRLTEEEKLTGTEIKRFKGIGQGTMATSGDIFFWGTLRPTLLLLAALLAIPFGLVGPIAFLVLFNIFHIFHRFQGFKTGYAMGRDVTTIVTARTFAVPQYLFEVAGLLFGGFGLAALAFARLPAELLIIILVLFVISLILLYTKRPYGYLIAFLIAILLILNFYTRL